MNTKTRLSEMTECPRCGIEFPPEPQRKCHECNWPWPQGKENAMEGIEARHEVNFGIVGGGRTTGTGMEINWQNGPLGRGDDKKEPNGAQVEDVIGAAIGRLDAFQYSKFNNDYNGRALAHLHAAIKILGDRTTDRERRGVEGTNQA